MRIPFRRSSERPLEMLRARLRERTPSLLFAEAVLAQAGQPLGATPDPAREARTVRTLCLLLERAAEADASGSEALVLDPVDSLVDDPELLSAFFQNVDLLYREGAPEAERIGGWVMAAVEEVGRSGRSETAERESGDTRGLP